MSNTRYTHLTSFFLLAVGFFLLLSSPAFADERANRVLSTNEIRGEAPFARDIARARIAAERNRYQEGEIIVKREGDSWFTRVPVVPFVSVEQALSAYQKGADVVYAEPNYTAYAFTSPNDPYYSYQWHLHSLLEGGVDAEAAWEVTTGAGAVVAVIDTGVAYEDYRQNRRKSYYQAPDLESTTFVSGYDFVNNDTHANDDNGHGTHVAGTIAQSTNNGQGVAGVAHGASIMPIKVLDSNGSGSYADVAEGIRWAADHGANVINLSLGGSVGASYLEDALSYAYQKGVTIVAAAGNDGKGVISYPAAYDAYVIAVGATRFDTHLAPYSNYGAGIDVVAPGGDTSVDQSGDGYGDGVLQQTFGNRTNDFGYYFYQGTSMATPHVAGLAALIISNGTSGPVPVREAIEQSAIDLGASGWDSTFGWGLVNAAAALAYTGGGAPEEPPPPPPEDPAPPENQPPTADAGADVAALVGEEIGFSGAGDDPDGSIVGYQWNFGDGSEASGQNTTHSFTLAGTYIVALTVTDDGGLSGSDTLTATISEPPAEAPPPPGDAVTMHVADITLSAERRDRRRYSLCRVTGAVAVADGNNQTVEGSEVAILWSGAYSRSASDTTGSNGVVSFRTGWVRGCGTFIFEVENVSKNGYIYVSGENTETSDSISL